MDCSNCTHLARRTLPTSVSSQCTLPPGLAGRETKIWPGAAAASSAALSHRQSVDELGEERYVDPPLARLRGRQRLAVGRRRPIDVKLQAAIVTALSADFVLILARLAVDTALGLRQPVAEQGGENVGDNAGLDLEGGSCGRIAVADVAVADEEDEAVLDMDAAPLLRRDVQNINFKFTSVVCFESAVFLEIPKLRKDFGFTL
eukprot:1825489-Pleurochrysis_carterae.AAC.5